jgi:hypothetical protein
MKRASMHRRHRPEFLKGDAIECVRFSTKQTCDPGQAQLLFPGGRSGSAESMAGGVAPTDMLQDHVVSSIYQNAGC